MRSFVVRQSSLATIASLLLLSRSLAFGQMNAGEIAGSVKDQLGGVLPGVTIVAEQIETGQKFTTTSNTAGAYVLPLLPIGSYSVTASKRDFRRSAVPKFEIHVGDKLQYDFTLQIGDATEVVTVEADAGGAQLE